MKSLYLYLLLILVVGLFGLSLNANPYLVTDLLDYQLGITDYKLSSGSILAYSEQVRAESDSLTLGQDYRIDYRKGEIIFLRPLDTRFISISYLRIPEIPGTRQQTYTISTVADSLPEIGSRRSLDWLDGDGQLDLTGSKTFALSFSDEAAFDLKQSLYVNLKGSLSPNMNILAQLSDSQSKLSPEGDSRELSTLDQVYVKLYGRQYEIAMGDLDWKSAETRFLNYETKFEGLLAAYRDRFNLQAGYSAASGKSAAMQIAIIEGKLGPYYLNADAFQSSYIIVAGSERIYLDGSLLERGTDYYIDYSEGTVMFRRLVIPANNITAYYQYTDENYKQSTLLTSFEMELLPGLRLSQNFIQQADDSSYPLLVSHSQADLDSLQAGGDSDIWGEGVFEVEPGSGLYKELVTSDGFVYYEYAPGDSLALYNVRFSYVGYSLGDYEQYSSGKYVYRGQGLGSWLPLQRLIAPQKRMNFNTGISYTGEIYGLGLEALYSHNDRNTLSSLDSEDDTGFVYRAHARISPQWEALMPQLSLDYENRGSNAYFFAQQSSVSQDVDLSAVAVADSASLEQILLSLVLNPGTAWRSQLSLLQRKIAGNFYQRGLRFSSVNPAVSIIPRTNLRFTYTEQKHDDLPARDSELLYLSMSNFWRYRLIELGLENLVNILVYDEVPPGQLSDGYRYFRFNPTLALGTSSRIRTHLSYTMDAREMQGQEWIEQNSSSSFNARQIISTQNNSLDLDFTHRNVNNKLDADNPKTYYDLFRYRSSHRLLQDALSISANYQLNQAEFFPRIRELEYVGFGLGLYDSTGVFLSGGDYDYTFITSDVGITSTEQTAQLSFFLRPGAYFKDPISKRFQSDLSLNAIEISERHSDALAYLFYPGYVFGEDFTIFGKQSYLQNLWIDLWQNRLLMNLGWEIDRSLDQRYQELSRTYTEIRSSKLELKGMAGNNFSFKYSMESDDDTRYQSQIASDNLTFTWQRLFTIQTAWDLSLGYVNEVGKHALSEQNYTSKSYLLDQSFRTVFQQKYRFSGKLGFRYNDRIGSDFLVFLPQKRAGFSTTWSLAAIYRINNFSSASLDYSGSLYPDQDSKHQLKLEFKAEL